MVEKRFCDRCNKQMPYARTEKNFWWNYKTFDRGYYAYELYKGKNIELCESCFDDFRIWVKEG